MEEESVRDKIEREAQEFADRAERWKDETKATPFYQRAFASWKSHPIEWMAGIALALIIVGGLVVAVL